jgi:pyruvate-ferredoxin/flavodoxin oxidoreductase
MENGAERGREQARPAPRDALAAASAAEATFVDRIATTYAADELPAPSSEANAFGDALAFERGPDGAALARSVAERSGEGERVTLLAPCDAFAAARAELARIATRRLPVVFHAFCDRGAGGAYALAGLGWAILLASSVQDSIDLALIARRAAEDSGTPFFVVHERPLAQHLETVAPPEGSLAEAFLGHRATRVPRLADPAHPTHARVSARAFAERVPFALGSAMRGLESFTGRKHDVIERAATDGAATMLVGAGALGDALLGEAERLKAAGHDVGAIKVTALRPFPGPRLIRALARAHVVTVLEPVDDPLAQSNPLTCEVKAAFADALTWAPEYPGIGRLPHIHSGVVAGHVRTSGLVHGDADAVLRNMAQGEQGHRLFSLAPGGALARDGELPPYPPGRLTVFATLADARTASTCAELSAAVVFSALALRCRVSVGHVEAGGEGATFDLIAARERPRGVALSHDVGLVIVDDAAAFLHGNPLARVARGGIVAVPAPSSDPETLWRGLPAYVKAIAFDRGLRVLGVPGLTAPSADEDRRFLVAGAIAGIALFAPGATLPLARPAIDGSLVEREVAAALVALAAPAHVIDEAARLARRAFESPVEVPRALIEGDTAAVKVGRHDARAV